MPSIADTLTHKVGPAPVWLWVTGGVALLVGYEVYRKRQQQNNQDNTTTSALSSNTGQPISNLTTEAQPMPIQMGDTFVQTTVNNPPANSGTGGPGSTMQPAPTKSFNLGGGWTMVRAGTFGAVDFLKNGKFVTGAWIPTTPGQKVAVKGTPFSISEAGDKAKGAVDVLQGSKLIGAYQT